MALFNIGFITEVLKSWLAGRWMKKFDYKHHFPSFFHKIIDDCSNVPHALFCYCKRHLNLIFPSVFSSMACIQSLIFLLMDFGFTFCFVKNWTPGSKMAKKVFTQFFLLWCVGDVVRLILCCQKRELFLLPAIEVQAAHVLW